jgi:hypothetical protein
MKMQLQLSLVQTLIILIGFIGSFESEASSCNNNLKVQVDMRDWGNLVAMKLENKPAIMNASLNPNSLNDHRFYKLDLSQIKDTRFQALDGTGIITKEANVQLGTQSTKGQRIANATAITSCYVLVNFHGPDDMVGGTNESPRLQLKETVYTHLGQGPSCSGNSAFKESVGGQVVAMGGRPDGQDWAFVKLNRKLTKVKPVDVDIDNFHYYPGDKLIRAGRPIAESVEDGGYQNIHAQIVSVAHGGSQRGLFHVSDTTPHSGFSGAAAFTLNPQGMKAVGIYIGGNTMLAISEINDQLESKYPAVFKEIVDEKCD